VAFHAHICGSHIGQSVTYEALSELAASVVDHNQRISMLAYTAKYVAARVGREDVLAMEYDK
jgi:hypothetical protein